MSTDREVAKEDVVYIYNGILLSQKKNKIMLFAATWMDMEIVILMLFICGITKELILSEYIKNSHSSVQSLSRVRLFATP